MKPSFPWGGLAMCGIAVAACGYLVAQFRRSGNIFGEMLAMIWLIANALTIMLVAYMAVAQ